MRTLQIGTRNYTAVRVMDEPGQGNANHKYEIYPVTKEAVEDIR